MSLGGLNSLCSVLFWGGYTADTFKGDKYCIDTGDIRCNVVFILCECACFKKIRIQFASVRSQDGATEDFPITIGLHQGSTLSPYLFTLVLDVLTEHIQELAPRCTLFADDVVFLGSRGRN